MRLYTTLFTLCLVSLFVNTTMGQGFSVSPSRLFFKGNPGETLSQQITFSNTSTVPVSFVSNIQDWNRDTAGNKMYFAKNSMPSSNANWITLSTNTLTVQPGETKLINVSMTVPAGRDEKKGLTNSMLFFTQVKEQAPKKTNNKQVGLTILLEVGVQIYHTPPGLTFGELEFLAFNDLGLIETDKGKKRRFAIQIHNKGEVNKDAYVRYEVTNKATGEELKLTPEAIAMLPDASQWVYLDLPADLNGKFLAVAILDAGSAYDLKVAEKEIIYNP